MKMPARKAVKQLKPKVDRHAKHEAKEYGYSDAYGKKIGATFARKAAGKKPVAKDTNKTRRKMVKPTRKAGM